MPVPVLQRMLAQPPSPRRVAAWSAALAAHLAVVAVLLLPRLPLVVPDPPGRDMAWVEPERVVIAPVPIPPQPQPRPRQHQPVRDLPELTVPVVEPTPMSLPAPEFDALPVAEAEPVEAVVAWPGASQAIAIATVTPPPYPAPALRRGLEGTVLLQVAIGADGVPTAAEVERSSGHRELDRAAREHVLAAWRFHPAVRNGQPVPASARVPIVFRIR
jgi:periplasmic protein TonB